MAPVGASRVGVLGISREPDSAVSRTDDNALTSTNLERGIVINPNTSLSAVECTLSSNSSDFTKAYIYKQSDGSLLTDTDISTLSAGDTFELDASLSSSTAYNITIDAEGANYTIGFYDSASFPYTSTDVDITAGAEGATGTSSSIAFGIVTIGAFVE